MTEITTLSRLSKDEHELIQAYRQLSETYKDTFLKLIACGVNTQPKQSDNVVYLRPVS